MHLETLFPAVCRRALALAFVSALVLPAAVHAAGEAAPPVSLTWNANPEPDVAGYKVHFGTQRGVYSNVIDVPGNTATALPQMLMGSTYYVAVSAYNTAGEEGPRSAEFSVTAAVPSATLDNSFAMTGQGEGKVGWKYPKSATSVPADGFKVYASEDLTRWTEAGRISPADASRSDDQWLYFEFPYQATRPRMFFKVAAGNAFGESE